MFVSCKELVFCKSFVGFYLSQEYDTCHLLKSYNGPPVEILVDQVSIIQLKFSSNCG